MRKTNLLLLFIALLARVALPIPCPAETPLFGGV